MNTIVHYGVKGMRWGIRRDNKTGLPRSPKGLSDTDLFTHVNRMELEYKYSNLRKKVSPTFMDLVDEFGNAAVSAGKKVVIDTITETVSEKVKEAIIGG